MEEGKRWLEQPTHHIPSKVYTKDAAEGAVKLAEDIVEFVSQFLE